MWMMISLVIIVMMSMINVGFVVCLCDVVFFNILIFDNVSFVVVL